MFVRDCDPLRTARDANTRPAWRTPWSGIPMPIASPHATASNETSWRR